MESIDIIVVLILILNIILIILFILLCRDVSFMSGRLNEYNLKHTVKVLVMLGEKERAKNLLYSHITRLVANSNEPSEQLLFEGIIDKYKDELDLVK